MTKGTIAIREQKADMALLTLEDYNVRANADKLAGDYLDKKWDEEGQYTRWMWYAGYFFLGCFFWETLPAMVKLVMFFMKL